MTLGGALDFAGFTELSSAWYKKHVRLAFSFD